MEHPLRKIISGGQTGADQGGLAAGNFLKLETGGTAPPGYSTDDGPMPYLLRSYGLVEGGLDPRTYPRRTERNILDSDGTVVFGNTRSPGTGLTIRLCDKYGKPHIENPDDEQLLKFVIDHNIGVLNVAGNRERRNPGIFDSTRETIILAFFKEK